MTGTIEERLERLETFMGNIDKITSVYANTIEEICNRWLNILYIEDNSPQAEWREHPNNIYINGFLTDLSSASSIPHNTIFFVRPAHDLAVASSEDTKIVLTRDNSSLLVALRKPDPNNRSNLIKLSTGDILKGNTYLVYINSQNLAVISTSDTGVQALELAQQLENTVGTIQNTIADLATSQTIGTLTATNATVSELTVSDALNLAASSSIALPTGSTISGEPTIETHVVNKNYVDTKIWSEIMRYHNTYHLFDTIDAQEKLSPADVPENAIYYKYSE